MREDTEDPRPESLAQRDDRNLVELIQELRVVGLGVQVLFGFLLSLPFTMKFGQLDQSRRDLYLASLTLAAIATALLLGPVAYHRLVFRQGLKEGLVRFSNTMAILGLAAVGGAVLTAVLLVTSYVAGWLAGGLMGALVGCTLAGLWFALPLSRRSESRRNESRRRDSSSRLSRLIRQWWKPPPSCSVSGLAGLCSLRCRSDRRKSSSSRSARSLLKSCRTRTRCTARSCRFGGSV